MFSSTCPPALRRTLGSAGEGCVITSKLSRLRDLPEIVPTRHPHRAHCADETLEGAFHDAWKRCRPTLCVPPAVLSPRPWGVGDDGVQDFDLAGALTKQVEYGDYPDGVQAYAELADFYTDAGADEEVRRPSTPWTWLISAAAANPSS